MMVYCLMLDDCPFYLKERKHYSPSHAHIGKEFNLSVKQVGRVIDKLKKLGLVEQVERGQKTNSYLVHRTKCPNKDANEFDQTKCPTSPDKMSEVTGQNVLHTNLYQPITNLYINKEQEDKIRDSVSSYLDEIEYNEYDTPF